MIKAVTIVLLIVGIVLPAKGQNTKLIHGIEAGPTITEYIGESSRRDREYNPQVMFSFGYSFSYQPNGLFSLKTGMFFERKGAQYEDGYTDSNGNPTGAYHFYEKLDYLIFPVAAKASLGKKRIRFTLTGGVFSGLLIQANKVRKEKTLAFGHYASEKDNIKSYFKDFDFGISASVGLSYHISKHSIFSFEVKENLGILTVTKYGDVKTNSICFLMGMAYHIHSKKE